MGDFNPDNYHDDFIADLVGFVASDDFQTMFEQFFLKYSVEFEFGEEQKLRYYEIYQDFHDLFENKLEEFCKTKGIPQNEFLKRCREATCEDEKSKLYMNILLSSVEYETFVKLMYIMKPVAEKRLAMEAEAKAIEDRYEEWGGGASATDSDQKGGGGAKGSGGGSVKVSGRGENGEYVDMKEMEDLTTTDSSSNNNKADAKRTDYDTDEEDVKRGSK